MPYQVFPLTHVVAWAEDVDLQQQARRGEPNVDTELIDERAEPAARFFDHDLTNTQWIWFRSSDPPWRNNE